MTFRKLSEQAQDEVLYALTHHVSRLHRDNDHLTKRERREVQRELRGFIDTLEVEQELVEFQTNFKSIEAWLEELDSSDEDDGLSVEGIDVDPEDESVEEADDS